MTVLLQRVDGSPIELAVPDEAELCFPSFKALVVERLGAEAHGRDVSILSDGSLLTDNSDLTGTGVWDGAMLTLILKELEVGASVFYHGGEERISGRRLVYGERGTVVQTRSKELESTEIRVQLVGRPQTAWFPAEAFSVCSRSTEMASFEKMLEMKYTLAELRDAGYLAQQFKAAGYSATQLQEGGFSASELRDCAYTLQQIRDAGCSWYQCKQACYTIPQLQRAGCEAAQLRKAGFSMREMQDAGYTLEEMKAAGFSCHDFREAGYVSSQCKAAGFTASEIECACDDFGDDTDENDDWYE
eukprot:TRINITY_DN16292_c0_g1_i1.p1 TRINITY_DN16292_c0_g1~~TRINITY_DN16292_c0_g1_i1.p1  ORF type:complete len:302 (-),score=40.02 TRINITY_DN16292_c0_g1_i1:127-1032(-)